MSLSVGTIRAVRIAIVAAALSAAPVVYSQGQGVKSNDACAGQLNDLCCVNLSSTCYLPWSGPQGGKYEYLGWSCPS